LRTTYKKKERKEKENILSSETRDTVFFLFLSPRDEAVGTGKKKIKAQE